MDDLDNFTFVSHPMHEVPHAHNPAQAGLTIRFTQRIDVLERGIFQYAEVHSYWHDHNDRLQKITTKIL